MTVTIESMVARWAGQDRPLFKGNLIDSEGCRCAQGDVLHCSGVSDRELKYMGPSSADRKVAEVLGISVTHSILLRLVNDKKNGCPGNVLVSPEKILGPEAKRILAFWLLLDKLENEDRDGVWGAVWDTAAASARTASKAAGKAHWSAARGAAAAVSWECAAATAEIQGHSLLKSPLFFLPLFGINAVTDLD